MSSSSQHRLVPALRAWWREQSEKIGVAGATRLLFGNLWSFVRDSTPEHRRRRYGDMEFDWQHRVDTTGGSVAWRERLLGVFHSPYQPTEPDLFREMMAALPIEFNQFTFIDLGSGKGRTLLMASDFPFRKILGVEILPALHHIAQENLRRYRSPSQQCSALEALCCDAAEFDFPAEPLLLYLFNPLTEAGLRRVMARLAQSWQARPRPLFIMYHHAALEHILLGIQHLARVGGTEQFSLYAFAEESPV